MKNKAFILAALAGFALTGCNTSGGGTSQQQQWLKTSVEEVYVYGDKSGTTVTTTYTYDKTTGAQTGESQSDGSLIYGDSDFKYEGNTITRTRHRGPNTEEVVSTLQYSNAAGQFVENDRKIFIKSGPDANNTVPAEHWLWEFDSQGSLRRYQYKVNEVTVSEQRNFSYTSLDVTFEQKDGDGDWVQMYQTGTTDGYKRYADWKNGEGVLVEQQSNYKRDSGSASITDTFKITKNGMDGVKTEEINVTTRYEVITITTEY